MKFFSQLFQDVDGQYSSKRFVTFSAFLLFTLAFVMNLFQGKVVQKELLDFTFYLVVIGLGMVASEKFTNRKKQ